jgi:hypothetical protein
MKATLFVLIALMSVTMLIAGISQSYYLSAPSFQETEAGISLKLKGAQSWGEPGTPDLPWYGVKLLLPEGNEAIGVTVKMSGPISYSLKGKVLPLQRQYPLSWSGSINADAPDPAIYLSDGAFPKECHNGVQTHFLSGHPIAFTAISPFEYYPATDELVFYQNLTVDIEFAPTARAFSAMGILKKDSFTANRLSASVDNPVPEYRENRESGVEYLIISDQEKMSNWQPLADYYEGLGISTQIVSVSSILSSTEGSDTQEKIRNSIIATFAANPLRYVLLAGDTDVIPHRGFTVDMGTGGESDTDIPADMYYSCLDGTWNNDGDNYWGEQHETDLTPELAIGRICYNSDLEIANPIYKIVTYQLAPVSDSIKKALFVGEWLWDGPTWGGDYMDEMIGGSDAHGYSTVGVPTSWDISTLYDRTAGYEESWGPSQIRPMLSAGPNLVNHLGHSNTTYNMRLSNSQVSSANITNDGATNNFSIYFSQGCYAGSFDNRETYPGMYSDDCITEKFTSLPTSAAGMIAHSRYGWGTQGSTNGASQYLHREYVDAIFGEDIHELGYTLVDSKIDNIPFITNQPVMYWVDYETNLIGCPAMMIWTDTPMQMTVSLPSQWLVGLTQYTIQTDAPHARFLMKKDGQQYYDTYADDSGIITINLLESLTPGSYQIYLNAPNFYPYQNTVFVTASEMPYVICKDVSYADDDNVIHTGEEIAVGITVKNVGMVDQANNGTVTLSSDSDYIQILQGSLNFTALAAGDSLFIADAFTIRIVGSFPDHTQADLTFSATFDTYETNSYGRITLAAPLLSLDSYTINGPSNIINPGDQVSIGFQVQNTGSGTAFTPSMILFVNSPYASTNVFDIALPAVNAGGTLNVPDAFTVMSSADVEDGSQIDVGYMIAAENGNVVEGIFPIHIGMMNYGFESDMQNWTNAQMNNNFVDQWHRSNTRNNTSGGTYSMKFGGSGSSQYASTAYGALISPEVTLGVNSRLKFYHWMDAEDHDTNPNSAWDGGLVQMSLDGGTWQSITPVGGYNHTIYNNPASPFPANTPVYSGAFDWTEATFELTEYSGTARFRFVFGSDGYVSGEGWYIDDVRLESDPVANADGVQIVQALSLNPNYPNPFNPNTNISFYLPTSERAKVEIFNIKGQRVSTLYNDVAPAGHTQISWNGKDQHGASVASGVYFYRLSTPTQTISRKMMLMK